MSKVLEEVLAANEAYASVYGSQAELSLPPGNTLYLYVFRWWCVINLIIFAARRFAILTCMDARLSEGDAHVIRNAGGRATDDAIRSLVISYKLLGTQEWFIIHHSDCGMQLFNDQIIAELLEHDLETASIDAHTGKWSPSVPFFGGSSEGKFIKWHTFNSLEVR